MKKTFATLLFAALSGLWTTDVWALSHSTHDGSVSVSKVGEGTVYLSVSDAASSGETSATWSCGGDSGKDSATYYLYAKPATGWSFAGWSGSGTSTDQKFKITPNASQNNGTYSYTATFTKLVQLSFQATENGTYTATDGTSSIAATSGVGELSTAKAVTMTAKPMAGYTVKAWWYQEEGQERVDLGNSLSYTHTFAANAVVGVEFMVKGDTVLNKTTGVRYRSLDAAVADVAAGEELELIDNDELAADVTLPADVRFVVSSGKSYVVPSDKILTVNGKVFVKGELTVSGAVSGEGAIVKVTKLVTQSQLIHPQNAFTTYTDISYCVTEVEKISPKITGVTATAFGVQLNGGAYFVLDKDYKVLVCSKVSGTINQIEEISEGVDAIENSATLLVVTEKMSVTKPTDKNNRLNFTGTIDFAGNECAGTGTIGSNANVEMVNAKGITISGLNNGKTKYYHCSGTMKVNSYTTGSNSNSSATLIFYDCDLTSLTIKYDTYNKSNNKNVIFYSGIFGPITDGKTSPWTGDSKYQVFGGSFKEDPTARIDDTAHYEAKQENGYYVVRMAGTAECVAKVGDQEKETLQSAIADANGARITLAKDIDSEDVEIPAGTTAVIELGDFSYKAGKIVNWGTLKLESSTSSAKGTVAAEIENHGTLQICYGNYTGKMVLKEGAFITKSGNFSGDIEYEGGATRGVLGGCFTGAAADDIVDLLPVDYRLRNGWVCSDRLFDKKTVDGGIDSAERSFTTHVVTPEERELYNRGGNRYGENGAERFTDEEWYQLAVLKSNIEPYGDYYIDCSLCFDRDVAAESITGYGRAAATLSGKNSSPIGAGDRFSVLIPKILMTKYVLAKVYTIDGDGLFNGNVAAGVSNVSGKNDNRGTTCEVCFDLCTMSGRSPNDTYPVAFTIVKRRFVLEAGSNVAMIRPEVGAATFYPTLKEACEAAKNGETVMLCNDCTTCDPIAVPCSFVLDTNGFAFTGAITAGEGYEVKATDLGDGKTKYDVVRESVAKIGDTPYASLAEAIEAAAESGETIDVVKESVLTVAEGVELTVTSGKLVAAVPADNVLELKDGTDAVLAWPTVAGAADHIIVTGGRYSADPTAFLAEGLEAKEKDGKWVVGVKVVIVIDEEQEEAAEKTVTTDDQTSSVDEEKVDEVIQNLDVTENEKKELVENIKTNTKVEGVKLTMVDEVTIPDPAKPDEKEVVKESGVKTVVLAAKAAAQETAVAAADKTDEQKTQDEKNAAAFKAALEQKEKDVEITVKVEVQAKLVEYVPPTAEAVQEAPKGTIKFELKPEAIVTVKVENEQPVEQKVPVSNDMIDQKQKIKVSMYAGFRPVQVLHRDDNGQLIEEFTGDAIGYENGIVSVMITHFSSLELNEAPVDPLAPTDAVKVADGFYQNGATYTASTEFFITSKAGLEYFRDLVGGYGNAAESYIEKGFWNSTVEQFYQQPLFEGKTVKLLCDVDEGNDAFAPIGSVLESVDKCVFYGIFDGCGHKISNLRIVDEPATAGHRVGLFSRLCGNNGAGVRNLTINNAQLSANNYLGGIAGSSGTAVLVTNCHLVGSVTISGSQYVGGMIGHVNGGAQVVDCSVDVLSGSALIGNQSGGVVGYLSAGNVKGCTVRGLAINAKSSRVIGGIAGQMPKAGCVVRDCSVDSVVITAKTKDAAGSVAGSFGEAGQRLLNNTVVNTHVYDPISNDDPLKLEEKFAQCQFIASGDTTSIVGWGIEWDVNEKIIAGTFERIDDNAIASGYEKVAQGTTPETWTVREKVVAKIGGKGYATLAAAVAAVKENETIQLLAGTIEEGEITLPDTIKNVTIKGAADHASILKNTSLAHRTNGKTIDGLTIDGVVFDNGRFLLIDWGNGSVKNLTFTNNIFRNLDDSTNEAAVHLNLNAASAVNGFTFEENVIDGCMGGQKSGIYGAVKGNITIRNNTINNVAFRPICVQIIDTDGEDDNTIVTGNTFSGSSVGRLQIYGTENETTYAPEGTDGGSFLINNNIFKGITETQQICCWGINTEKVTTDITGNYYDAEDPRMFWNDFKGGNSFCVSETDIAANLPHANHDSFNYYTGLKSDGTIDLDTLVEVKKAATVAKIAETGKEYQTLQAAFAEMKSSETVELLCDVDLKNEPWMPVVLNGGFDGKGYSISNLVINLPEQNGVGFFSNQTARKAVRNVEFVNVDVKGLCNVGAIFGRNCFGPVENVKVTGTIKVEAMGGDDYGYTRAGVICGGWSYAAYTNVCVDGGSKATSYVKGPKTGVDGRYVAGFVGHLDEDGYFANCTVKNLTVDGKYITAGFCGDGPGRVCTGCTVENVDLRASYSGALFGWLFAYGDDPALVEEATIRNVTFADNFECGTVAEYTEDGGAGAIVKNVTIENVAPLKYNYQVYVTKNGDNFHYANILAAVSDPEIDDLSVITVASDKIEVPAGYELYKKDDLWGVRELSPVVRVGDIEYSSIEVALANSSGDVEMILIGNATCGRITLSDADDPQIKSLTLDLNGFTLTDNGGDALLTKDRTITIRDSVGTGVFNHTGSDDCVWLQGTKGGVYLESGTFHLVDTYGLAYATSPATTDMLVITGGTYNLNPSNDNKGRNYVPDGYEVVDNRDGTWTVQEKVTHVAAVISADGTVTNKYATLPEAQDAATDGQTVQLIADCGLTGSEPYVLKKSIDIDLNGKTLALKRTAGKAVKQMLFIGTDGGSMDINAVTLYTSVVGGKVTFDDQGGNTAGIKSCSATTLTVGRSVNDNPVVIESNKFGIFAADNSHLVVNSADITAQGASAISTNGSNSPHAVVTINGGTFETKASLDTTIYNPSGNLIIRGGTFKGVDAVVWVRGGSLTIDGGVFSATGTVTGGLDNGDAIVIESCDYPAGVPVVSISGGAFSSVNGSVIGSYHTGDAPESLSHFVTGGVFNKAPAENTVAEGYEVAENPDEATKAAYPWKVQEKTVKTEDGKPIEVDIDPKAHESQGEKVPVVVTQNLAKEILGEEVDVAEPLSEGQKTAIVTRLQSVDESDGMTGWQKYTAGFSQTDKHPLAPKGKGGEGGQLVLVTSLVPPKHLSVDTGVKVKYILMKGTGVDAATGLPTKWEKFGEPLDTPEFPVAVAGLDPETYWKIEVEYTATKTVETEVEVEE